MSERVVFTGAVDRRRHQRVEVSAPASFVADETIRVARCVNLSMGGAGLRIRGPMPTGSVLKLKVNLGNGQVYTLAQIVRSEGAELGVRFMQLDPGSLGAILANIR